MDSNSRTTIDFSAQFGCRDAAAAVLPHFWALKAAAKEIILDGFPYPQLAFILRVDGDISQFGFSGTGEPDVAGDGKYLSVDIGITKADRGDIRAVIRAAILNSVPIISAAVSYRGIDRFDVEALRSALRLLCEQYTDPSP